MKPLPLASRKQFQQLQQQLAQRYLQRRENDQRAARSAARCRSASAGRSACRACAVHGLEQSCRHRRRVRFPVPGAVGCSPTSRPSIQRGARGDPACLRATSTASSALPTLPDHQQRRKHQQRRQQQQGPERAEHQNQPPLEDSRCVAPCCSISCAQSGGQHRGDARASPVETRTSNVLQEADATGAIRMRGHQLRPQPGDAPDQIVSSSRRQNQASSSTKLSGRTT